MAVSDKGLTIGEAANGITPTIAAVCNTFNRELCRTVIQNWILSINAYVGKSVFTDYQATELSSIIATEAYYLTLAELAIFFNWVKAGKFGQIYGQLDPVFITSALQQFLITRRDAIDKYNRDTQREKIERSHDNGDTIKSAISLSSYEEYKKRYNSE